MKIDLSEEAQEDLIAGYYFYEKQSPGLGAFFLDSLYSDIDSILIYAGTHPIFHGSHRSISKRFPYAIFYRIQDDPIRIRAVFDCRQRPAKIKRGLRERLD